MSLQYREFPAGEALGPYIECFWTMRSSSDYLLKQALVTGGRAELIFSNSPFFWYGPHQDSKPKMFTGAFILGQRSAVNFVQFQGPLQFFGIRFRYGCMPLFLKGSAARFSDTVTELPKPSPAILYDIEQDIRTVENWLLEKLGGPPKEWFILQELIRQLPEAPIGDLAAKYNWNYKRVERVFSKYTGFPPRTFLKILRFRIAVEKAGHVPGTYTGAAHELGYYDQSHFIREFRRYTSESPSSFYRNPPEIAALLYKLKR